MHSCGLPGFICRFFCFIGIHRWSHPGGHCDCCGKCDEFFGPHDHDKVHGKTPLQTLFDEVESKLPGDLWDEDDV